MDDTYLSQIPRDLKYTLLMQTEPQEFDLTCSLYPEYERICENPNFIEDYLTYHGYDWNGPSIDLYKFMEQLNSARLYAHILKFYIEPYILDKINQGEELLWSDIPLSYGDYYSDHIIKNFKNPDQFLNALHFYWPIADITMKKLLIPNIEDLVLRFIINNRINKALHIIDKGYVRINHIIAQILSNQQIPLNIKIVVIKDIINKNKPNLLDIFEIITRFDRTRFFVSLSPLLETLDLFEILPRDVDPIIYSIKHNYGTGLPANIGRKINDLINRLEKYRDFQ